MKKLLLLFICVPLIGLGQTPQGLNYQAVARDSTGAVLINNTLTVQFSIISDSITGNISWQETHSVTTNDFGLFTTIIGQGTSTSVGFSATFDKIDWGSANHFLNVQIDGLDMGTTQFMSVPYALYAKSTEVVPFEYYDLCVAPQIEAVDSGTVYFMQFYAPSSGDYTNFTFFGGVSNSSILNSTDTFSGTVGVAIYDNVPGNPGVPSGIVAQGEHTYVSEYMGNYKTIPFNSPATLEANKLYWAAIGYDAIPPNELFLENHSDVGLISTNVADSVFSVGVGFLPSPPSSAFFIGANSLNFSADFPLIFWFRIY